MAQRMLAIIVERILAIKREHETEDLCGALASQVPFLLDSDFILLLTNSLRKCG